MAVTSRKFLLCPGHALCAKSPVCAPCAGKADGQETGEAAWPSGRSPGDAGRAWHSSAGLNLHHNHKHTLTSSSPPFRPPVSLLSLALPPPSLPPSLPPSILLPLPTWCRPSDPFNLSLPFHKNLKLNPRTKMRTFDMIH